MRPSDPLLRYAALAGRFVETADRMNDDLRKSDADLKAAAEKVRGVVERLPK